MIVAAIRLTFIVPPDGKSTHSIAHKVKDRLWSKFKIAISEVPSSSSNRLVLGAALVDHEEARAHQRTDQIIKNLNEWGAVELVHDEVELIHFDDLEMERDLEREMEKYEP